MNVHENARLTPRGRELLISRLKRGEHPQDAATAMGVSASTVYKWRQRHQAEGVAGLRNHRSSRPNASPATAVAFIKLAMIRIMLRRLASPSITA